MGRNWMGMDFCTAVATVTGTAGIEGGGPWREPQLAHRKQARYSNSADLELKADKLTSQSLKPVYPVRRKIAVYGYITPRPEPGPRPVAHRLWLSPCYRWPNAGNGFRLVRYGIEKLLRTGLRARARPGFPRCCPCGGSKLRRRAWAP